MEGLDLAFIISAFVAGLLTFLAPCTLPMVPSYIGFISGVPKEDLENPETRRRARLKIFMNGMFFVLGFSLVFIAFGALAGLVGQGLASYRVWLSRIGGLFVIFFGLFMMGVFRIPFLQSEKRFKLPGFLKLGKPSSSLFIGGTFGLGWTPCIGPILGSILLLAGTQGSVAQGVILLAVFSLGLAVPFIIVAALFSVATKYVAKISKYLGAVSFIGGILLVLIGVLLLLDNFALLLQWGYAILDFLGIDYSNLLDRL